MKRRIRRFDPLQTGKVLGVLYALIGLVFLPFFWLIDTAMPSGGGGWMMGFGLLMPIVYGVFGLVFGAIGAFIYNLVAGFTGGLELDIEEVG